MSQCILRLGRFQMQVPKSILPQLYQQYHHEGHCIATTSIPQTKQRKANIGVPKTIVPSRSTSRFSRKLYRKPVKVYMPGEKIPQPGNPKAVEKMPLSVLQRNTAHKNKMTEETGQLHVNEGPESTNIFNSVMGEVMMTKGQKLIALEGTRLIVEAMSTGLKLEKLFLLKSTIPLAINNFLASPIPSAEKSDEKTENDGKSGSAKNSQSSIPVEIHKVSLKHMQTWSSVTTPPGVIGIFKRPSLEEKLRYMPCSIPVTLVCDNVREPGNLGALLRSAAGAGCKRVLLSKGCANPWESKVLRAGSGAHFYMPIRTDVPIHSIQGYIGLPPSNEDRAENLAPSSSPCQYMNVVPERQHSSPANEQRPTAIFLADCNENDPRTSLPIWSYLSMDYRKYEHIYLIFGGETEGLSDDTLKIADALTEIHRPKVEAARLKIPLQCQMQSLNVAHAFAIIVFEILRQKTMPNI